MTLGNRRYASLAACSLGAKHKVAVLDGSTLQPLNVLKEPTAQVGQGSCCGVGLWTTLRWQPCRHYTHTHIVRTPTTHTHSEDPKALNAAPWRWSCCSIPSQLIALNLENVMGLFMAQVGSLNWRLVTELVR